MPINSCEHTKRINRFEYVPIPSPRDVFLKYGERVSSRGEYTSSGEGTIPSQVSSCSTIDSIINAEKMIAYDLENNH